MSAQSGLSQTGTRNLKSQIELTLYWQADQAVTMDYTVFVHLVDPQGHLLGQHDGPPGEGEYPTSWWLPGQAVVDRHAIQLSEPYGGSIVLRVGMYDPASGVRVPAFDGAGHRLVEDAIPLK